MGKICNKCKLFKEFDCFCKDKSKKDGYRTICRKCSGHKARIISEVKECKKCKIIKPRSEYYSKSDKKNPNAIESICISCTNKTSFRYIKVKEGFKFCYKCNTEKPTSDFFARNSRPIGITGCCKKCRRNYEREYERNRKLSDSDFRIRKLLRNRIRGILGNKKKIDHTINLLGCSISEVKVYLQQTAIQNGYKDFNIESYSGKKFHIDHIKPCSSFDLSLPENQKLCFHYTNLQILSAKDNLKKSNR